MKLTHLSLFSGIGGLDLAAEMTGEIETVGQCEWADYPTKVLEKHWPDVPRWRDIRTLTGDDFYKRTGKRTVDIVSGGFPCQPFSVAGQRRGQDDDRYLWPEMLRVIEELEPRWVVGENVDGLLSKCFAGILDDILRGLDETGYYPRVFSYEAAQVGALQRRRRTFIVAHSKRISFQRGPFKTKGRPILKEQLSGLLQPGAWDEISVTESDRDINGFPNRMDRLRCLGNAVIPRQAYPIFQAIVEVEKMMMA